MLKNFRTYLLAVNFYRQARCQKLPGYLQNQLERAASSIALNLAEGYGRRSKAEQRHFYTIAMGSLRECQAAIELCYSDKEPICITLDTLAAHLYKLLKCYG